MPVLDSLDRKILGQIEHRADISFSALARSLKRGRDTVEYRIQQMTATNIILGFRAVIDFYKLGLQLHKCYLRLAAEQTKRKKFIEHLRREPRVLWIAECNGEWDLIFAVAAPSLKDFYDIEAELLSKIADIVIASEVFAVVEFSIFQSKCIVDSPHEVLTLGERWGNRAISSSERALLAIIASHARLPLTEIAKRIDSSLSFVREKLKQFEKEQIIVGYQTYIDLEKLGFTRFKTQLFLRDYQRKEEALLRQYCAQHPNVIAYIRQIGTCRTEIELYAKDYVEYANAIDQIREEFPSLIRDIKTTLLRIQHFRWDGLVHPQVLRHPISER